MARSISSTLAACALCLGLGACDDPADSTADGADGAVVDPGPDVAPDAAPVEALPESALYDLAGGCVSIVADTADGQHRMQSAGNNGFGFDDAPAGAAFFAQPSDLGTYLFYDDRGGYLVAEDGPLRRQTTLASDVYSVDDGFVSGAEWIVERSPRVSLRLHLRHRRTGGWLGLTGVVDDVAEAAPLTFEPVEGCRAHPEMSLDAAGQPVRTHFDDGELFGFVDAHEHALPNFGYGGGGIFHGSAFHRLGVEVAMGTCEPFHGPDGRADLLGGLRAGGTDQAIGDLIPLLTSGLFPEPKHATDGWPTFSDWPSFDSATHNAMYFRWIERAWLAGLRLMVQYAVSNDALCALNGETGFQPIRWSCRDMVNIDRQFEEIRNLERYIDARAGGPGQGWLRVVEGPAEAREVIGEGKLAVVLGIEVPDLFECYVTPGDDDPTCDRDHIEAQLDAYHARGLRVLFPTHKTDNAFTPGDGSKGIFELANLVQTGHWSNFTDDCPDVQTSYDHGRVVFGGLNQPRDAHLAPAPMDPIELSDSPLTDLSPLVPFIVDPPLDGDWCQAAGMTDQGRLLMQGIMARGIVPDLDHLPRRSYIEAFDMLEAADYPSAATHRNLYDGRLWDIGGTSALHMARCADGTPGSLFSPFLAQRDARVAAGLHPAVGFAFDFNGLAGVPAPRFGERSGCDQPQEDPVRYPFASYDGGVMFTQPFMGERAVDFNTEGMIHIGLVPELIEDARRTGTTDEELEVLFRSAEGYIRMWERAEARAAVIRGQ